MSIRRLLVIAFIAISLLPTAALTWLAFAQARGALRSEIARHLEAQAVSLMEQVDRMLFERLENIRTWRQLDVLQETRIRDLDKRVSEMLTDLKAGYGVYAQLFCTTQDGEVIAASDPALIGSRVSPQAAWLRVPLATESIDIEPFTFAPPFSTLALRLRAPLRDLFNAGEPIGTLYALFDWSQVLDILDQVEAQSPAVSQEHMAILLDAEGRPIAASSLFRQNHLMKFDEYNLFTPSPAERERAGVRASESRSGVYLTEAQGSERSSLLVGYARSQGVQSFNGFGWSMFVVQPTSAAYRPVLKMGGVFLVLLLVTAALAVGVSLLIAARISRPVMALTEFTRRFARDGTPSDPPPPGPGEIGELTQVYTQLIHDLEKSRDQLVRAAKLAVAGEMAATMTHEIRTPLGILRSSAQMLQRESHLSPEGREMAGFVVSETDRLNQLVSSLLSFARPTPPVFATHDLHRILTQTMTMITPQAERKGVRFVSAFQDDPALVTCDEDQMMQVFLNLFINAFQVLVGGGTVSVRTHRENHQFLVEVADTGPGIPPLLRQKVFEPFFTTRENGIGLGLTVVHQIVHGHGATIAITENSAGGACFAIQFPQERSAGL